MKKDGRIELLRVVACIFVICIHVMRPDVIDGEVNDGHLFLHAIVGDAVSIFFTITGCFMYRGDTLRWKQKWLNYLINILLPTVVIGFVISMLMPILDSNTLNVDFRLTPPNLLSIIEGLLFFQPGMWSSPCSIYWYVFEYARLLVFYPVCYAISKNKDIEKLTIWVYITCVLLGDINHVLKLNILGGVALLPASVTYSLLGDYLYSQHIKAGRDRKKSLYCLGVMLTIALRFILQKWVYNTIDIGDNIMVHWTHAFSFLFVYFVFQLILSCKRDSFGAPFIRIIGGNVFYVYLFHIAFVWKLIRLSAVYNRLTDGIGILYCLQIMAVSAIILLITMLFAAPARIFHVNCIEPLLHTRYNNGSKAQDKN